MAPKGNKNALGNKGGVSRKTSFSPDEMILLGIEMVQWLKEHPETLHLSEWYTIEKMFLYNEWKAFIQRPEFLPYYEVALKIVGKQYLDKNSDVRNGVAERWQRVYFKDIREQEDQDAQDKIDRESKSLNTLNAPLQDDLDMKHENMILKNEIEKLKADANKC